MNVFASLFHEQLVLEKDLQDICEKEKATLNTECDKDKASNDKKLQESKEEWEKKMKALKNTCDAEKGSTGKDE